MKNITVIQSESTIDSLTFKILDLEYQEKEYDLFRIKIAAEMDWTNIPVIGTNLFESASCTFGGLNPLTIYHVVGQAKYKGVWEDVVGAAFKTHPRRDRPIPTGESHVSGIIGKPQISVEHEATVINHGTTL